MRRLGLKTLVATALPPCMVAQGHVSPCVSIPIRKGGPCPHPVPSHQASHHPIGLLVPDRGGGGGGRGEGGRGDTHRSTRRAGETAGTSWTLGRRTESDDGWLPCHPVPIPVPITNHPPAPSLYP